MTVMTRSGVLLSNAPAQSETWHALRRDGIGASDVAPILGLSPWESPYSLWHAKAHGWATDPTPEMAWGTAVEPAIRGLWCADHSQAAVPTGTWAHRTRQWQRCNPDGLILDEHGQVTEGLEIKTCGDPDADWGKPGTDEIPVYYRTQVMWSMDVLGLGVWRVAVSRFGRYPDYYEVRYDAEEARLLREHCVAFWHSLRHGVAPELDGTNATLQTVRRLHPDIDGEDVIVPDGIADAFAGCRADLAVSEQASRLATTELLQVMGSARRAVRSDGTPVARRQPGRAGSISLRNLAKKGD